MLRVRLFRSWGLLYGIFGGETKAAPAVEQPSVDSQLVCITNKHCDFYQLNDKFALSVHKRFSYLLLLFVTVSFKSVLCNNYFNVLFCFLSLSVLFLGYWCTVLHYQNMPRVL